MSEATIKDQGSPQNADIHAALFAHLAVQQANMAMMLLGKTPNPETGQTMRDLEAAKLFIDTLEMLEAKTKGNLSAQEQNLLKQTLMTVRMAFVESSSSPPPQEAKPSSQTPPPSLERDRKSVV